MQRIHAEYNQISQCLRDWPESDIPEGLTARHLIRLASCLGAVRERPHTVGWADLAILVRQVLRAGTKIGPQQLHLSVPVAPHPWPTEEQWGEAGVTPLRTGNRFDLGAEPWNPDWLDGGELGVDSVVADAPHRRVERKSEVPIDPFIQEVFPGSGYTTYSSKAHRDAVRKVVASQPGATVVVNLPTGSGKSTVALAPAFLHAPGTSVFVVPTIALAIDQERRVRELTGRTDECFAFTSDTPLDVRKEILAAIFGGHKTVVFVAPEAATHSLAPALFKAARLGALKYFIVDESHLVDQWGTQFRPEYQALAGLRSELLKAQREADPEGETQLFRTILMTATMGPGSVDLLMKLFDAPGPVELAISNRLRPEPGYWVAESTGLRERSEHVVEALLHLPRPAIVYCMTPAQAQERHVELVDAGFKRSAVFHGKTTTSERREIMKNFRSGEIDLVVATSAFGVGVDQADVRTIVHACIPETIDRYYQEVGRAGRDGSPSVSLLCWTESDKRVARKFAFPSVITPPVGIAYWNALRDEATVLPPNRLVLPLNATPIHLEESNEEVERWHIRTIALLVRSGLLRLAWDRPPEEMPSEGEIGQEARNLVVELTGQGIDLDTWGREVEPVREQIATESGRIHGLMIDALKPRAKICELIQRAYELDGSIGLPGDRPVRPTHSCGGCPAHRDPQEAFAGPMPPVARLRNAYPVEHELGHLLERNNVGLVAYRPGSSEFGPLLAEAIRALVVAGVRAFHCPPSVLDLQEIAQLVPHLHLQAGSDRIFFVNRDHDPPIGLIDFGLPLLVVLEEDQRLPRVWFSAERRNSPTILVLPEDYPDPGGRPDTTLMETRLHRLLDISMIPGLLGGGRR